MKFFASAVLALAAARAATAFIPLSSFSTTSSTTSKPAPVGIDLVVVNDNMNNKKYRRSVSFLSSSTETEEAATEEDASAEKFEYVSYYISRCWHIIIKWPFILLYFSIFFMLSSNSLFFPCNLLTNQLL
jgi:hypothetical protein